MCFQLHKLNFHIWKLEPSNFLTKRADKKTIGHFRVPKSFTFKTRLRTFVVEMSFICIIIKTHFHNKGFALSLVLKVKLLELGNGLLRYVGIFEFPQSRESSTGMQSLSFYHGVLPSFNVFEIKISY